MICEEYAKVRAECEKNGWKVDDQEFDSLIAYAERKAEKTGNAEIYIPCLLSDVIREYVFSKTINSVAQAVMGVLI